MRFGRKHKLLRNILMLLFFIGGLLLVIFGWKMTGQLQGLGLMILGIIFLLTTLFLYNETHR